jgi:transposase
MSDAARTRRAAVVADLVAGMTLLAVSLKHNVSQTTASRWLAESGLTRTRNTVGKKLSLEKKKAIAKMLRDGVGINEIRRRAGCSNATIDRVRSETQQKESANA